MLQHTYTYTYFCLQKMLDVFKDLWKSGNNSRACGAQRLEIISLKQSFEFQASKFHDL